MKLMKMNLKPRDLIAIAVVAVASFPVMFLIMMFLTGNARIEFTPSSRTRPEKEEVKLMKRSLRRDSLAGVHSKAYEANVKQKEELAREREKLQARIERLTMMEQELEQNIQRLNERKRELEAMVESSSELEQKRIRQLARVYGAMRPNEAAQILATLDDELLIKIITAIGDDRQKAKIVAGLPRQKAVRISRKLGKPPVDG